MICTGVPTRCQCQGRCPTEAAIRRGDQFTPINEAARKQDAANKKAGRKPFSGRSIYGGKVGP